MYGQEEMPLSISEGEEVIHIIEVFLIILFHYLFCQKLWKDLYVVHVCATHTVKPDNVDHIATILTEYTIHSFRGLIYSDA